MSKKSAAAAKPTVSVTNLTSDPIPRIAFRGIARRVFARPFDVSLVIVGDARAKRLNLEHRNKSYVPNVLSFPLTNDSGEIFLNLKEARRQFRSGIVDGTWTSWVALLVIHSFLHLNGMRHGRTMERTLERILRESGFRAKVREHINHGTSHHHRN